MSDLPDYTRQMVIRYEGGFIGLEELARRLGSFVPWDLKGNIIVAEGWETEETEWVLGTDEAGSEAVRQTRHKYSGDWAVKLEPGDVAGADAYIERYLYAPEASRITYYFMMGWEAGAGDITLWASWRHNLEYYGWGLQYNKGSRLLAYEASDGSWVTLESSIYLGTGQFTWWPFSVTVDLATGYYVKVKVGGMEYDLSSAALYSSGGGGGYDLYCAIMNEAVLGVGTPVYIDNVIIAENAQ